MTLLARLTPHVVDYTAVNAFADRLIALRGNRPLVKIATPAGICHTTLMYFEAGRGFPSDAVARRLAGVFDVDPTMFVWLVREARAAAELARRPDVAGLALLRIRAGLSRSQLAKAVPCDYSTVVHIERHGRCSTRMAQSIAGVLLDREGCLRADVDAWLDGVEMAPRNYRTELTGGWRS